MENIMSTIKSQWAVYNKQTGKIGRTRESKYSRRAVFPTRTAARAALKEGRVFAKASLGRIGKYTTVASAFRTLTAS